jgi:hypothetical protein
MHTSHASYDKIQHHHLIYGGKQQYHKNSWTMRNAKIHGQGGMQKFPSHQTQSEPTQFHQHEIFLRL